MSFRLSLNFDRTSGLSPTIEKIKTQILPDFLFTGVFLISKLSQKFLSLTKIGIDMPKVLEVRLIEELYD